MCPKQPEDNFFNNKKAESLQNMRITRLRRNYFELTLMK